MMEINPAMKTIVRIGSPLGRLGDTGSWPCRRAGGLSFPNGQDAGFFVLCLSEGLISCKGGKGCSVPSCAQVRRDETLVDAGFEPSVK